MWREIGNYNVVDNDGNVEKYTLERSNTGGFRLKNDFGNISIEFDQMNALEFFRKVFNDVTAELDWDMHGNINDLFGLFDDDDLDTIDTDCNGGDDD